jgi:hypothetical protein
MSGLSLQHQGRELLHGIEMRTRCLQVAPGDVAQRRQWRGDIRRAKTELAALYAAGLDPDFRTPRTGRPTANKKVPSTSAD